MGEGLLPGNALTAESEFQGGLTGACGPNACSAAGRWSDNSTDPASTDNTVNMNYWLQKVVNSPNGVATLVELEALMKLLGYKTIARPANQSAVVFANVALEHQVGAVVMFYTNAQVLTDVLTGEGMDASGLQGHFNCLLGRNTGGASPRANRTLPPGYWVSDGDNNVQNPVVNGARVHRGINTDLVYYADSNMLAAGAADAFLVLPRHNYAPPAPPPPPPPPPPPLPDIAGALTDLAAIVAAANDAIAKLKE